MPALDFPSSPTPGQLYPPDPGTSGVTQYRWNDTKGIWDSVYSSVSLGIANQGAFNDYQWPASDGTAGYQLTTNGTGTLSWEVTAAPVLQVLSLLEPFDGVRQAFTLVEYQTSTPFIPNPSTNLVVFLGGVPQMPTSSYSVTPGTDTIIFSEPPLTGSTFYAISNLA